MAVDAAVDALYMDNLDEFINDEDKVVTYRWLSTTLQVHVNQAKQMLYNFVTKQRNSDKGDNLNVTYFVAGLQKAEEEGKVHHCEVVSEDRLDAIKSKLRKLYSCHIYSVQKSKLQESNALYITDYNLMKENVFDACKYSSIKFDVERKIIEPKKPVVPEIKRETVSPSILDNGTSEKKKKEKEPVISAKTNKSKTGIAGMFAKANSIKKESPKSNGQNENPSKTETKETAKKNPDISKKQGGVMAFFNSAAKKTKPLEVKPLATEKEPVVSEKKKNEKKKKIASSDSDDDFLPRKKKRRRIKDDMFDSSSEEEEGLETEDPFANSPPSAVVESDDEMQQDEQKNKDKAASEDEEDRKNDVVDDDDEEPIPDTPEQRSHKVKKGAPSSPPPTPSSSSSSLPSSVNVMVDGRRRKRIKRKKKKTYLNDEGFMVTETVMESDSTDASDIEPPQQQAASSSIKDSNLLKNSIETKKLKAVTGVKAPADKGKQKQASLMSFFSKK